MVRQVIEAVGGELASSPPPSLDEGRPSPAPVRGTQAYMPPEHLRGEGSPRRRADQYSFCVMAWELLFGVRPFAGDGAEAILGSIAAARLDRGQGRPRGMPKAVEAVLRRGLSERADERWPSVEVLITKLERARSRPWRLLQRAVVIGLVLLMVGSVGRPLLSTSSGGGFVDYIVCMTAGPQAVALVRAGDTDTALQLLENAQRRASESQMRLLAIASQQVGLELEARGEWDSAVRVWGLSVRLARDAGDGELARYGHTHVIHAAREAYSSSALKQVTVPSSLVTPSKHQ